MKITAKEKKMLLKRRKVKAGKVKVSFRVGPEKKKVKYYKDINDASHDFNESELENASISVVMNGTVVGDLRTDQVLDALF
ncbi:unnamed protein product [marine sediment metagenome]|uniref:Uncharacterized protein n=1 Tax=marine sediment metagenome TaxID=412755 RepID=X0VP39_9ZZZZ